MKSFKQHISEAVKWTSKWDGTLNAQGKKVMKWTTADGKYELTLTGYKEYVGKSHPHGSKKTSWMITDLTTGEHEPKTHSNLTKAKKVVSDRYK